MRGMTISSSPQGSGSPSHTTSICRFVLLGHHVAGEAAATADTTPSSLVFAKAQAAEVHPPMGTPDGYLLRGAQDGAVAAQHHGHLHPGVPAPRSAPSWSPWHDRSDEVDQRGPRPAWPGTY